MKLKQLFLLVLSMISFIGYAQNIFDLEINPVCSSDTFNVEAPNSSFDGYIITCDGESYPQENVAWYHIRILDGNTFTFLLEINPGEDYDFAVWLNPNCEDLGPADRGSFIHEPLFGDITQTGLMLNEEDECEGLGPDAHNTPGMVRHLDVQPGDDIYLMIYRPSIDGGGLPQGDFSVVFDGTGGDATLDCSIIGNTYEKCDLDGNEEEDFVESDFLTDLQEEFPGYQFEFYETNQEALDGIGAQVNFPLTVNIIDNPVSIFVRVEEVNSDFHRVIELKLNVLPKPVLNNSLEFTLCDDNFDGIYETNLMSLNNDLINPNSGFIFNYYASHSDFQNNIQIPQNEISAYEFSSLPASVWVVGINAEGFTSEEVEVKFDEGNRIIINPIPYEIPYCPGEIIDFSQHEINFSLESGVNYTYYETESEAENSSNPINTISNYIPDALGFIYVRLEKINKCPEILKVEIIAGEEVQHNLPVSTPLDFCPGNEIDFTILEPELTTESDITFSYFESISDAENNLNSILNGIFAPTQSSGSIYVKLEKLDRCSVIIPLNYNQKESPEIEGLEPLNRTICQGDEIILIEATTNVTNANFVWNWGNNQTLTGNTIEITQPGTYVLTVTDEDGCVSSEEIIIEPSPEPIITLLESGSDYINILADATGNNLLEYSLNGIIWQSSPRFSNLIKGEIYTIYVRENGCMISKYQTAILDISNFISPNGDGYNDTWSVRGIEVTPDATIKIFDRYGKIFVDTNFEGNYIWDGKYNGMALPSGSYWYILEIPTDGIIKNQKFTGSVSIRNL